MNLFSKLSTWYFSRKALPYWSIILLDCLVILFSGLLVYALNNGIFATMGIFWHLSLTWGVCLVPYLVGFRLFRTYSGIIRYSSFVDLQRVGFAVLFGVVCVVTFQEFTDFSPYLVYIRKRDLVLSSLLAMSLMWAMRVFVKYFYVTTFRQSKAERAFIFGVKQGGISLAKSIQNQDPAQYVLAGFVSEAGNMQNRILMGVRVYPFDEELIDAMRRERATILFVSPLKSDSIREQPDMVARLAEAGIKIYVTPAAQEWDGRSDLTHTQLRKVEIEDLLPREKIEIDMEAVGRLLRGQRILITGAAGSIGSEICRQLAHFPIKKLVCFDSAETPMHNLRLELEEKYKGLNFVPVIGDVRSPDRVDYVFRNWHPQVVFHAAAYKHVPLMEENPCEAIRTNVFGTRVMADAAVSYGVEKFVMISTDKAVNPTNIMGCSKRLAEIYVQSLSLAIERGEVKGETRFITTRFGNVLGSNGSVIPRFREQIAQGGPVTVTHPDIIRYFMTIPEACRLVLEAGTMGKGGEIFIFDMGEPVKIADLAKRMIELSGLQVDKDIEIKYTGLRPGEKLYEELLNNKENTKETPHEKIRVAAVREYDYKDVVEHINVLTELSLRVQILSMVKEMKAFVPEFKSQNSQFEELD